MNRSIIVYMDQLEEGIIGNVGSHLKRNWKKYALGGAALAAGGAVLNPALATQAGTAVSGAVTKGAAAAGKAFPSIADKATSAGKTIAGGVTKAGEAVAGGMKSYQGTLVKGVRKFAPDTYAKARLNVAGMGSGGSL